MRKNVAEICLNDTLGGLEFTTANCFEYFKDKTDYYAIVAPNTKLDNLIKHKNKFTIKRNKILPFIPTLQLAKIIDNNNIDIVHFHLGKDIIPVILAKLFSKKKPKIVYSRHMNMTRFKNDIYHRWLYKNIELYNLPSKLKELSKNATYILETKMSHKTTVEKFDKFFKEIL